MIVTLFSGGKDSTYCAHLAGECTLLTMVPQREDSYMFHHPNISLAPQLAECMGKDIVVEETAGEKEKELEDLRRALEWLKPEKVFSGAVASSYQKTRIDKICADLGIESVAPLWQRPQEEVLAEELGSGMEIVIVGVYAEGLGEDWLGRRLDEGAAEELRSMQLSPVGEGGEFETLVVDAPFFGKRLEIAEAEKKWDGVRGTYEIRSARTVAKE
ncbi:MAG: diphthine--ammonia ligase [Candidatus Diapherotrites archaeon]|nr:diphthine--ammonia ligase [Candidatus Diapherotrites archaeon]